jgi:hypothetical protein
VSGTAAAVLVAVLLGLAIARAYAARKILATGSPWFVWFRFGMPLFIGGLMAWIGLSRIERSMVFGLFMVALGLAIIYLGWRYIQTVIRSIASATTPDQRTEALLNPLANYVLGWFALMTVALILLAILAATGLLR